MRLKTNDDDGDGGDAVSDCVYVCLCAQIFRLLSSVDALMAVSVSLEAALPSSSSSSSSSSAADDDLSPL